ncbi:MAG: hypothetical protein P8Y48_00470 [Novosphingobium sp.]
MCALEVRSLDRLARALDAHILGVPAEPLGAAYGSGRQFLVETGLETDVMRREPRYPVTQPAPCRPAAWSRRA